MYITKATGNMPLTFPKITYSLELNLVDARLTKIFSLLDQLAVMQACTKEAAALDVLLRLVCEKFNY